MTAEPTDPLRIAIVDAVESRRRLLVARVAEDPTTVLAGEGSTGPAALALLADTSVDVLLMGTAMPEMDGLTTLRVLRAGSSVPVVVLAEELDVEAMLDAISLGAAGYLSVSDAARRETVGLGDHLRALLSTHRGEGISPIACTPEGQRATLVTVPAGRVAGIAEVLRSGGLPLQQLVYALLDGPEWLIAPLARRLHRNTPWRVLAGREGDLLVPGHVLMASLDACLLPITDARRLRFVRRGRWSSLAEARSVISGTHAGSASAPAPCPAAPTKKAA